MTCQTHVKFLLLPLILASLILASIIYASQATGNLSTIVQNTTFNSENLFVLCYSVNSDSIAIQIKNEDNKESVETFDVIFINTRNETIATLNGINLTLSPGETKVIQISNVPFSLNQNVVFPKVVEISSNEYEIQVPVNS
ncbi:hypothetical protein [Fervidicoccus fontis]|jgi:hypothetical protein|uniref:hypothetical protein n=1 Tax=Fervidicoccus fontis TaxID=683846 RepID=UPI0011E4E51A|nr:hypothetical protein [Fervidicoccus fontis]